MGGFSVRFYKRLIVAFIGALIVIMAALAVFFYFRMTAIEGESVTTFEQLEEQNQLLEETENKLQVYEKDPAYSSELFAYQSLYPDLVADKVEKLAEQTDKVVYLTFDDGPSDNTPEILDILDQYGVKATFFVVNYTTEKADSLYKQIVDRGHTIGVHSASHQYTKIYASVEAYLEDFKVMYDHILAATGTKVQLFRFPGGSINAYNMNNYCEIIAEMVRRGFTYYDWNVSSGDAASNSVTAQKIYDETVSGVRAKSKSVVLMHDSVLKNTTVEALPKIIETLQKEGYTFKALDSSVKPFVFSYRS